MINLLRNDFYRLRKDKSVKVIFIITIIFAFLVLLAYSALKDAILDDIGDTGSYDFGGIYFNSFSVVSNMGFIIPLISILLVSKDLNYGTIRNKLICGKKRYQIYLSEFIVTATASIVIQIIYSALLFAFVFILGWEGFDYSTFGKAMATLGLGVLLNLVSYSLALFYIFVIKKTAGAIIAFIGTIFGIYIIGSILSVVKDFSNITDWIYIFQSTILVKKLNTETVGRILITSISSIAIFNLAGILIFNHSDVK